MKTYQTYAQIRAAKNSAAVIAFQSEQFASAVKLRASENANRAAAFRAQMPRILADKLATAWGAR